MSSQAKQLVETDKTFVLLSCRGYQIMNGVLPAFHLIKVKSWRMHHNFHAIRTFANLLYLNAF
jgi:hypothetical protein